MARTVLSWAGEVKPVVGPGTQMGSPEMLNVFPIKTTLKTPRRSRRRRAVHHGPYTWKEGGPMTKRTLTWSQF